MRRRARGHWEELAPCCDRFIHDDRILRDQCTQHRSDRIRMQRAIGNFWPTGLRNTHGLRRIRANRIA